ILVGVSRDAGVDAAIELAAFLDLIECRALDILSPARVGQHDDAPRNRAADHESRHSTHHHLPGLTLKCRILATHPDEGLCLITPAHSLKAPSKGAQPASAIAQLSQAVARAA